MGIREKIRGIETLLIGNRVTAIGSALLAGGIGATALEGFEAAGITTGLAIAAGGVMVSYTGLGHNIKKIYDRTSAHIKRFGKIDKRYFNKTLGSDRYSNLAGYCQLQAMYLACRDISPEILPEFYQLKSEQTKNIVPNF